MQTLQYTSWGLLGGGILFRGATYLWLDPGKQCSRHAQWHPLHSRVVNRISAFHVGVT